MKLFILILEKNWPAGYDCNCQFLVRAKDEQQARTIANNNSKGDEHIVNPNCWLNSDITSCYDISNLDEGDGVIMSSPFVSLYCKD
jgi:hypothetical protein